MRARNIQSCTHCESEFTAKPSSRRQFCSAKCFHLARHRRQHPVKPIPVADFSQSDIDRFWAKVDRSGGADACWPWLAHRPNGYGAFRFCKGGHRQTFGAHRVALALSGTLDAYALHRCDNPPCCNPAHLWNGTQADNGRDATIKGRRPRGDANGARLRPETRARGEFNGNARLTAERVREARERAACGELPSHIAVEYGISLTAMSKAINRLTWRHV